MSAAPTTVKDLETFIGEMKYQDFFNEDGTARPAFSETIQAYVDQSRAKDPGIQQQIDEQVQATVREQVGDLLSAEQGRSTMKVDLRPGSNVARSARKTAPGAPLDEIWDDHGEFLQAVYHNHGGLPNAKDLDAKLAQASEIQNSYGTGTGADGGHLVPEEFRQAIMTPALEEGITRPYATVIPMSTAKLTFPAVDDSTHASNVLFGGVACYWAGEESSLTESSAKFGAISLEPADLTAYAPAPANLVADAPAFLAWLMAKMPAAIAWSEDAAFISGTGAGQPLGWATAANPAAVSVTRETGQSSGGDPGLNTIVWENLVKAYARMLPTSQGRARWVANINTFPELATMALNVGVGGAPVWLNQGAEGPPARILGRPVDFTEKTPTLGAAGDIHYVDLSYYGIGDRQAATMESSRDYLFASNKIAFKWVQRVDGRPMLLSPLTPKNDSTNTLSAFVKIAQRSS
jgi:HK97 family phage major capsid protein